MATQPDLTDEQRANLKTLAAYLRTLPDDYPDFEMDLFSQDGEGTASDLAHLACGTAACAVGHGPSAGIAPLTDETWREYSERAFVTVEQDWRTQGAAWGFLFDEEWSVNDNTAHGAAARIEWLLANGVPINWEDQRDGWEPLCYRAPASDPSTPTT